MEKKYENKRGNSNEKMGESKAKEGKSRFSILEEEDIIDAIMQEEGNFNGYSDNEATTNKAHNKGKGKRLVVQITEKQFQNMQPTYEIGPSSSQSKQYEKPKRLMEKSNSKTVETVTQNGGNKAAAYDAHLLVRGNNKDMTVTRDMVGENEDTQMFMGISEIEISEHHNDPPPYHSENMEEVFDMVCDGGVAVSKASQL